MQAQNSRFKKTGYLILGTIALVLTYIGLIMPGIPTTPFLLLTAYFYLRSSDNMYAWLLRHRVFGRILREFSHNKTVSLRMKGLILLPFWGSVIVAEIWLLSTVWWRIAMLAVGVGVSIAVFKWKRINLQTNNSINPVHMEVKYTYNSSIDYINNLKFDYIETYSLQRGDANYEKKEKESNAEYMQLLNLKDRGKGFTAEKQKRYNELYKYYGFTQYLVDAEGNFHPSGQKINTFYSTDPEVLELKAILQMEVIDVPMWMCAPVYRDAIVFYDNMHRIVSVLNVCLGCQYMELERYVHINAGAKTYDSMRQFFISIGHPVESE